jgi:DNA replication initiation complex subunit (GINS family)
MYNQLYAAWQREIDDPTLGALPTDFYVKIGEYLRRIKDEDKVLDKKSVKMNLLLHEAANVERMLKELLETRYRKLIKTITKNQKAPIGLLTVEEEGIVETFADFTNTYQKFADDLMQGRLTNKGWTNSISYTNQSPTQAVYIRSKDIHPHAPDMKS